MAAAVDQRERHARIGLRIVQQDGDRVATTRRAMRAVGHRRIGPTAGDPDRSWPDALCRGGWQGFLEFNGTSPTHQASAPADARRSSQMASAMRWPTWSPRYGTHVLTPTVPHQGTGSQSVRASGRRQPAAATRGTLDRRIRAYREYD